MTSDMGLGKTLEAIDLDWQRRLDELKSFNGDGKLLRWNKPTLVLTRMSVVPEWERHYEWMLPHLRVVSLDPKDRASFLKAVRDATGGKEYDCFVHNVKSVTLDSEGCATLVTTKSSKRRIQNTLLSRQLAQLLGVHETRVDTTTHFEPHTSNGSTGSHEKSTSNFSSSKITSAPSVGSRTQEPDKRIALASITVTRQDASGVSSASNVTPPLHELIQFLTGSLRLSCTCRPSIFIMHWDALRLLVDPKKDPNKTMVKTQWFHIIGDEIHAIKNRKAKVTKALKSLRTDYKTGLSGTPADNKPHDLWSVLNWLYPGNWRSYWNFYKAYVKYEVDPVHGYHKVTGVRNAQHLHQQLKSFYIRRRKEEVAKELPDKYHRTLWVDLSPTQRRAYNQMKKNMLAWVGEHEDKPMAAPAVVTQLMRLQQFCVSSVDIQGPFKQRKKNKDYRQHLVDAWIEEHGKDVPLPNDRRYQKWYEVEVYKHVLVDPSTKLDVAMELIEDSDEPIVFFSQFKGMVNLFEQRLKKAGVSYGILTGDTPQDQRGQLVRDFQAGKLKVFAGTIAAGGIGITLTRSSHVVFFDRAWSPSWNRQAEDRLHRIGQKNAVQVTDIMARGTIDLGRVQQIQQKWGWIQMILGDKVFDYQRGALQAEKDQLDQDHLQRALQDAFEGTNKQ